MKLKSLISFWVLACAISAFIWLPLWWPSLGLPVLPYHHAWGALGPALAAIIITQAEGGRLGLKRFLSKAFQWDVKPIWYIVALATPFVLLSLSLFADQFFTGARANYTGAGISSEFPELGLIGFFIYNLVSFGIGEELGWRGFMLPRLQGSFSAFTASLVLSLVWALWHLPLFFYRPGYMEMGPFDIIGWVFSLLTGSIILAWLFNSTRGSVLICALFHASMDIAFTSNLARAGIMNYVGALVTILGIGLLIFAGPVNLSRKPRITHKTFFS